MSLSHTAQLSLSEFYLSFYVCSITREALLFINKCRVTLLIGNILENLIFDPLTWRSTVRSRQILPGSVLFSCVFWSKRGNVGTISKLPMFQSDRRNPETDKDWQLERIVVQGSNSLMAKNEITYRSNLCLLALLGSLEILGQMRSMVPGQCWCGMETCHPRRKSPSLSLMTSSETSQMCGKRWDREEGVSGFPLSLSFPSTAPNSWKSLLLPAVGTLWGNFCPCSPGTLHHKLGEWPQPLRCSFSVSLSFGHERPSSYGLLESYTIEQ